MSKDFDYDLGERFVEYSVRIIRLSEALPDSRAGRHIASQILRSGTSPAPNYAEAQSAESRKDFIHKLKVALKELRETHMWMRVIHRGHLVEDAERLKPLLKETDELIAILFASIETAKNNQRDES